MKRSESVVGSSLPFTMRVRGGGRGHAHRLGSREPLCLLSRLAGPLTSSKTSSADRPSFDIEGSAKMDGLLSPLFGNLWVW